MHGVILAQKEKVLAQREKVSAQREKVSAQRQQVRKCTQEDTANDTPWHHTQSWWEPPPIHTELPYMHPPTWLVGMKTGMVALAGGISALALNLLQGGRGQSMSLIGTCGWGKGEHERWE